MKHNELGGIKHPSLDWPRPPWTSSKGARRGGAKNYETLRFNIS